jgi:hypothetical protein
MFFRRETPNVPTFQERVDALKKAGFEAAAGPGGQVRVSRGGIATVLDPAGSGARAGVVMGAEIGWLVDTGNQKIFRTPGGSVKAATADELKAIHAFEEDLKEGLGLKSLYNESLGTVSTYYLYDRVEDRDRGVPRRPWQ